MQTQTRAADSSSGCGCRNCRLNETTDASRYEIQSSDAETDPALEFDSASALEFGLSPLARRAKLHPGKGARKTPWDQQVYGLVVHTTGGALPGKARKAGRNPDEYAVTWYLGSGGTHYVNGWAGIDGNQLHQVMNERQVAWGVGRDKKKPALDQWRSVDAGRFERDLPATVLRLWRARWPGVQDSLSLLPVRGSANLTYVHVECVPCVYSRDGNGPLVTDPIAKPMREGLRFTKAQHETVARLAWDIAQRHGWLKNRWWRTARLVGHEDITPLSRHDRNGGWDPGGLRDRPYFDWSFVYAALERMSGGTHPRTSAPALSPAPNPISRVIGGLADRFRGLIQAGQEIVAITQAAREGYTDVNKLTNLVFFARHPELNGRPLRPEQRQLAEEWLRIRDALVRPALARLTKSSIISGSRALLPTVLPPTPSAASGVGIPSLGGPRVPPGYREKPRGLARSSSVRLDAKLLALHRAGAISITDRDLDTLQRIANVETMGTIQALNTWDTGVVSIGFMQWTLLWGELQKWILRAPAGFARYGITVDSGRRWTFKSDNQQLAIAGVAKPDELRWNGWAQRFYLAGLDDELIAVEVQQALELLQKKLERMRKKITPAEYALFKRHYDQSPELRAVFQEAYNNRPRAAISATTEAVREPGVAALNTDQFQTKYKLAIQAAFVREGKTADHLLQGTSQGARVQV